MLTHSKGQSLQQNEYVMVLHTVGSPENLDIKITNQPEVDLRAKYT